MAAQGFLVAVPDWQSGRPIERRPSAHNPETERDVAAGLDHLATLPNVRKGTPGIVALSRGPGCPIHRAILNPARSVYTRPMRRLIALIVMLVIPLQFAWAAAASLQGHLGENTATFTVHSHHDHHHPAHGSSDYQAANDASFPSGEDGQHGNHCHPVFSSLIAQPALALGAHISGGAFPCPSAGFSSRTPPLLDRPPLARA